MGTGLTTVGVIYVMLQHPKMVVTDVKTLTAQINSRELPCAKAVSGKLRYKKTVRR
jgi:hypothetical protein